MVETLKVVAFILAGLGIFGGFILGSDDGNLVIEIALPYWISGIISYLVFAALALILEHVKEIHVKLYPDKYANSPVKPETPSQEA